MMCDVMVGAAVPGVMHVKPIFWCLVVWVGGARTCDSDLVTANRISIVLAYASAR